MQWHMGRDIPFIPGKRTGGIVIGDIIAPIFFNTAEDSGCIPIQAPVAELETGDVITVKPFDGVIEKDGKVVSEFDYRAKHTSGRNESRRAYSTYHW